MSSGLAEFQELHLRTTDGLTLRARRWEPLGAAPDTSDARVLIVHGWGDCSERHRHVAEAFMQAGFGGLFYDLRGHGLSEGRRGDFRQYSDLLADFKIAGDALGSGRVIVVAFSFGAQIAINALSTQPCAAVVGLSMISPWLRLAVRAPRHKLILAHLVRAILPGLIQKTPLTGSDLSSDDLWLEELRSRADAQGGTHRLISVRAYFAAMENGERALALADDPDALGLLPVYAAHGTADSVTDPRATRQFIERYRGSRKTFVQIEGARHELQNEDTRDSFLNDLIKWARAVACESAG